MIWWFFPIALFLFGVYDAVRDAVRLYAARLAARRANRPVRTPVAVTERPEWLCPAASVHDGGLVVVTVPDDVPAEVIVDAFLRYIEPTSENDAGHTA